MNIPSVVAASRMIALQRATDITADNIANASTPGFKTERVQFSDWLSRQAGTAAPPGGNTIAFTQDRATWRDQRAGTLSHTGNTFDVGLSGDGFFTVNTPRGTRLTRDGRFGPMPDGTLADSSGNAVMDANGKAIQLGSTDTRITVAADGTISSENGQLGKIGVVRADDPMRLTAEGGTLYRADVPTQPVAAPGIVQGTVEDSNVQPVVEITRLISDMREFQSMSQFIQAESDRQQAAIDKLLPQGGA